MVKTKKIFHTFILALLSFAMMIGSTTYANAATKDTSEIILCSTNISYYSASLNVSGIKAKCTATITAKSSMNLKIKMELQKEKSSGYETVKTWTSSKTGTALAMTETRNINILYDYRLKVTFTAGSEIITEYRY